MLRGKWLRMLMIASSVGATCVLILRLTLPDVSPLAGGFPERTSYMRLRAAELEMAENTFRVVPTDVLSASPLLACAMVKSEDNGFFEHSGINWYQLLHNLTGSFTLRGSSGITQQLARNLYLGPEFTLMRKFRETLIALELERRLSKRRILELYLNVIEWGDGVWGAGPAAGHYFHKSAVELDAFEASFLSALTAAPQRQLSGPNLERAEEVQRRVLLSLYLAGIIDEKTCRDAELRSEAVFGCLREGNALEVALACSEPASRGEKEWGFFRRAQAQPLLEWIDQNCGGAREMAELEYIDNSRDAGREQRP